MEIQKLITKINRKIMSNRKIEYIVIHYTANNGDTAKNNCKYFEIVNRQASAHYFVDENSIWQCVEEKDVAWHCGAKKYYSACRNSNSIGIELCSRKDKNGKYYFKDETIKNAIELTKELMKKYNIDINHVIRHYDVTRKVCPEPFVRDETKWHDFLNELVEKEEEEMRYQKIEEVPEYAKSTIQKLIDKKILNGNDKGLDLSEDMVRMLVMNDRAGIYSK